MNEINNFSILFIAQLGGLDAECLKYRVLNVQEYLKKLKIKSCFLFSEVLNDQKTIDEIMDLPFQIVVFYRTSLNENITRIICSAKKNNKILVYDIDEICDPQVVKNIAFTKKWNNFVKERYLQYTRLRLKCLLQCNYLTTSSSFIADYVEKKFKIKSYVLLNGLNHEDYQVSLEALKQRSQKSNGLTLIYLSGTSNHQEDFQVIIEPLKKILKLYPKIKLKIIGLYEIPNDFLKKFKKQIIKINFKKWKKVLKIIRNDDINLYPLNRDIYNEAKSELKYFQTAMLKIPSVVTPTRNYQEAIKDGFNGYLANGNLEWFQKINQLIISSEKRKKIGESAFNLSKKKYYFIMPDHVRRVYLEILKKSHYKEKVSSYNFKIPLLVRLKQTSSFFLYSTKNYFKRNFLYYLPLRLQKKIFHYLEKNI